MGNEASLEGEGLPEGLAAAAAGGGVGGAGSPLHTVIPAGMEADLSQLSEEERRQIAAVMSRAQGLPKGSVPPAAAESPSMHRHAQHAVYVRAYMKQELDSSHSPKQPGKPPDPGRPAQPGLSKSRTTDTFKSEQKLPGRSPSTISLKESKSRTDFKEEHKSSMMPGFLSEVNPLSAVSSVVNKFNPFDLISDSEVSQEEATKKQKVAQKDQGKPEGITKPPPQQQSPKFVPKQQGPVRDSLQQDGSPKSASSQQPEKIKPQPPGTGKPLHGPAQLAQTDQAKSPLQRDAARPQAKQSDLVRGEPVKPTQQSPSKSPVQQATPGKSPAQQPGPEKPQPGPTKPAVQQPGKTLAQQQGTVKPLAQSPGTIKPPAQQAGSEKPSSQQPGPKSPAQQPITPKAPGQQPGPQSPAKPSGPGKTPVQQPGPGKAPVQQPGSGKSPAQQPGPGKAPTQQPTPAKPPPQQPAPAKPPPQQPAPAKPPPQKPSQAKPPPQQPGPAKPSAQQSTKPVSQMVTEKTPQPPPTSPSVAQTPVQGLSKTICPLCNTTELLLHIPEKANFNTCTECQTTVCSLCGFNPNPHLTKVKEWLCLNCQMQRALGGELAPIPSSPQPKPKTAPVTPTTASKSPAQPSQSSPKKEATPKQDPAKAPESKKPPLVKQPTLQGSPAVPAKQPPAAESSSKTAPPKDASVPSAEQAKAPTAEEKSKQPKTTKPPSDIQSSAAATKPDVPSSQVQAQAPESTTPPVKTDSAKPSQSFPPAGEKVTPFDSKAMPRPASDSKIISQPGPSSESKDQKRVDPAQKKEEPKRAPTKTSPKPDAKQVPKGSPTPPGPRPSTGQTAPASAQPLKPQEQSRRFSLNLGSITDGPRSQPTTPQETVTGKLFGFGASIFSQASNLISTAGQTGPQPQGGPTVPTKQAAPPPQPPTSQGPPKPTGQAPPAPAKAVPVKKEAKAPVSEKLEPKTEQAPTTKRTEMDKKPPPVKDSKPSTAEPPKSVLPDKLEKTIKPKPFCPLCKTELNIGSQEPPNFNTCTECKNQVCNLCGFNPTPHLTEVSIVYVRYVNEWFILRYYGGKFLSKDYVSSEENKSVLIILEVLIIYSTLNLLSSCYLYFYGLSKKME
ncbi:Protein piccolo [Sciurus carolinensis]|uniref:Protein piccolo n=1 Tax=Sciurus carolinensis TaxID=30640 RepID=A0AA41N127_SCICA|nr:Protein piccolo [Sciurus carolinensis]